MNTTQSLNLLGSRLFLTNLRTGATTILIDLGQYLYLGDNSGWVYCQNR